MQHMSSPADALSVLLVITFVTVALALLVKRQRGGLEVGGNTIVRCQSGHLFSTIWVPGLSFKAIRLGTMRFQYCPVGGHWALVTPVNESELSEEEQLVAYQNHDQQVP
jgi:hypothetical protein